MLISPRYQKSWLKHSLSYFKLVKERFLLDEDSFVIEVASNDGYLLKNFVSANIPCLGIEPTTSTAVAAEKLGVPVLMEFFGSELGSKLAVEGKQADLIIGNNVFAHVPDINDFTLGLAKVLKPNGVVTLEFPHLLKMIKFHQFDTAYHEHFSYLSLNTVRGIFAKAGLRIWDVEEIDTHGGSLRIYGCHDNCDMKTKKSVDELLYTEKKYGLLEIATYNDFQASAEIVKNQLVKFLIEQKQLGKSVAAYGAAAKGNTILNFGGIGPDLLPYVCDAAPSKQGKYMPGSHIPILSPEILKDRQPEFIIILPWNISKEVMDEYSFVREWGAKFVIAVPKLRVL